MIRFFTKPTPPPNPPSPRRLNAVCAPPGEVLVYRSDDGDIMIDDQGRASWLPAPEVGEEPITLEQLADTTAEMERQIGDLYAVNASLKATCDRWEMAYDRACREVRSRRWTSERRAAFEADIRRILGARP